MSKLERKNHKVFGINATETKVGQFGSANATTKITTKDVEKIQALDAWEQGWEAGAVGNNRYPTQQERTGVDYEHSYQIGYMLQEGVPEWNKDTTYNKGSIVKAYNGTTLQNYVSLVDDNLNNAVTDAVKWKSGLANSDFSNLTEAGEKHFLNKSQITNCILELPQRIKYTWIDGILTILKGSVVIVPYETEDKTADYPIGATFLNDNLKVVDTQFAEDSSGVNRFIVWAELQNDTQAFSFPTTDEGQIFCYVKGSEFGFTGLPLDRISSGTTAPTETNTQFWFDTNNNLVKEYGNKAFTGKICSFPLGIGTIGANDTLPKISQVFNGAGCIGSTIWADKGVKGLIPDGRNSDETLKNIEYTSDKLVLRTYTTNAFSEYIFLTPFDSRQIIGAGGYFYVDDENNYAITPSEKLKGFPIAISSRNNNGKSTQFRNLKPYQAENHNADDDMWVCLTKTLISYSTNNFPANYKTTFNLSSYLPQDGYKYELIIDCWGNSSAGGTFSVGCQSSLMYVDLCKIGQGGSSLVTHGTGIIITGQDRKLTVLSASGSGASSANFSIVAYRKVK